MRMSISSRVSSRVRTLLLADQSYQYLRGGPQADFKGKSGGEADAPSGNKNLSLSLSIYISYVHTYTYIYIYGVGT